MLQQLKHLDCVRLSLEELVTLSAFAKGVEAEFQTFEIEVPEWLDLRKRELTREIRTRQADELERRLRSARLRVENLKTPEEKRQAAKAEVEKLEALLKHE